MLYQDNLFQGIHDATARASNESTVAFERPDDTTAYGAGDVVGEVLEFENVLPKEGKTFIIVGAKLRIDLSVVPSGMSSFRLHLYNAAPTAVTDNAEWNLIEADRSKYAGYITLLTPVDFGDTLWSQEIDTLLAGKMITGNLYGILVTTGAFTPVAKTAISVSIIGMGI